jgi:hypothetical protein
MMQKFIVPYKMKLLKHVSQDANTWVGLKHIKV